MQYNVGKTGVHMVQVHQILLWAAMTIQLLCSFTDQHYKPIRQNLITRAVKLPITSYVRNLYRLLMLMVSVVG